MSTAQLTDIRDSNGESHWTYGSADSTAWPAAHWKRFGGAYPNGHVSLQESEKPARLIKCASYRKAVRKLRQWCNGYNV